MVDERSLEGRVIDVFVQRKDFVLKLETPDGEENFAFPYGNWDDSCLHPLSAIPLAEALRGRTVRCSYGQEVHHDRGLTGYTSSEDNYSLELVTEGETRVLCSYTI